MKSLIINSNIKFALLFLLTKNAGVKKTLTSFSE
jgi:hypothetical protein